MQSIDLIETYAYGTSKVLVNKTKKTKKKYKNSTYMIFNNLTQ